MTKGAISLCVESFAVDAAVTQFAAVVQGASDGSCKMPAGQNDKKFLGFSQAAQDTVGAPTSVMTEGVSPAISYGAIAAGDKVRIHSANGDVESCEAEIEAGLKNPAAVDYVIGEARNAVTDSGQVVYVKIRPQVIPLAVD